MFEDCLFCKIQDDSKVIIWQNDFFFSIFDSFPVSPGHALIITKRHVVGINQLNKDEWKKLQDAVKEVVFMIEKADLTTVYSQMLNNAHDDISRHFINKILKNPHINHKPDGYNHGVNDGKVAGRTIDHFHWHLIPRFASDIKNPQGGVRSVISQR